MRRRTDDSSAESGADFPLRYHPGDELAPEETPTALETLIRAFIPLGGTSQKQQFWHLGGFRVGCDFK